MESPEQPHAPIIVAFDPFSAARETIAFGIAAHNLVGAPLVVVAVRPSGPLVNWFGGAVDDSLDFDRTIEHVREDLRRRHVEATVRVVKDRSVTGALENVMSELSPELLVVGATTKGERSEALAGTTAERVLHVSRCPVAVIPKHYERPEGGVQIIGVAFSATPEGREALQLAAEFARGSAVRLRAVTVLDPDHAEESAAGLMAEQHREVGPDRADAARGRLTVEGALHAATGELAADLDVDFDVLTQDPAEGLIAASRHVDLLVMGSRRLGPKRGVLLGSVSRRVAAHAACPVLIVPRGSEETAEALVADAELHGSH